MCGCLSHVPCWGPGPQPRHVPWLGWNQRPFGSQPALSPLRYTSQGWSVLNVYVLMTEGHRRLCPFRSKDLLFPHFKNPLSLNAVSSHPFYLVINKAVTLRTNSHFTIILCVVNMKIHEILQGFSFLAYKCTLYTPLKLTPMPFNDIIFFLRIQYHFIFSHGRVI